MARWVESRLALAGGLSLLVAAPACGKTTAQGGDDAAADPEPEAEADADPEPAGDGLPGEADSGAGEQAGAGCPEGSRPGGAGRLNDLKTDGGLRFILRTPDGYAPTTASPLIVVFAPAGADPAGTESFTGLTPPALARGFIIAYADHVQPTGDDTTLTGAVPKKIVAEWCVDESRVYYTGHSDGGSEVVRLIFKLGRAPLAAAVAPSAAGTYLMGNEACPEQAPLSALILHSKDDENFPGYGRKLRDYFVRCDRCNPSGGDPLPNGCVPYGGCQGDVRVEYCEGTGSHGVWPKAQNDHMLDFFTQSRWR